MGFQKLCFYTSYFYFLKLKSTTNTNISNLNVKELNPPPATHVNLMLTVERFDYVSDSL